MAAFYRRARAHRGGAPVVIATDRHARSAGALRLGWMTGVPVTGFLNYLMARMNTSAGFWPLFFDSCFTPRPMNSASPAFQLVLAGFPSSCSEMSAGARAITT